MTEPTEVAPPALLIHCQATYARMFEESRLVEVKDSENPICVYEGKLTELITGRGGLYLSVPYYTRITAALKAMGCARQLKRGGGSQGSQWELITEPTLELFNKMAEGDPNLAKTTGSRVSREEFESLQQQVRDLARRADEADVKLNIIIQALPEE